MASHINSIPPHGPHNGTSSPSAPTRRALFGAAAAAAIPLAAMAAPVVADASPTEAPDLLAICAELDVLKARHEAAVERLGQAEALALETCPPVPDSLKPGPRHPDFQGSFRVALAPEVDALDDPVGPFQVTRGQCYPIGTVASSSVIRNLIASSYDPGEAVERMKPHLDTALAYEGRREAALEASGLPAARRELNAAAQAIWSLVPRAKAIEARTATGVLVKARVLLQSASTWDEHGRPHGRLIAAAAAEDLIASVVRVLGEAV